MTGDREAFLGRVREAVQAGNRPGSAAAPTPRGQTGYQGDGGDPVGRFCAELQAAGGQPAVVAGDAAAIAGVLELVEQKSARRVLLGKGALIDRLELAGALRERGVEVYEVNPANAEPTRDEIFAADLGITEADYLVAETGTIVQLTQPDGPRSLSLLPPVHIVIANRAHILPDLFDLFEVFDGGRTLPSCLTLITGPSKTGDIELRLVTGVHGPGEVHAFVIE